MLPVGLYVLDDTPVQLASNAHQAAQSMCMHWFRFPTAGAALAKASRHISQDILSAALTDLGKRIDAVHKVPQQSQQVMARMTEVVKLPELETSG